MSQPPSWTVLTRLAAWLDPFRACFGHEAQRQSLRAYVDGLLSDSARKSMQAMLARVTTPRSYIRPFNISSRMRRETTARSGGSYWPNCRIAAAS